MPPYVNIIWCDSLSAFMEAHLAIKNGIRNDELMKARIELKEGENGKNGLRDSILMKPQFGVKSALVELFKEME